VQHQQNPFSHAHTRNAHNMQHLSHISAKAYYVTYRALSCACAIPEAKGYPTEFGVFLFFFVDGSVDEEPAELLWASWRDFIPTRNMTRDMYRTGMSAEQLTDHHCHGYRRHSPQTTRAACGSEPSTQPARNVQTLVHFVLLVLGVNPSFF
jgi:hypothetical protein